MILLGYDPETGSINFLFTDSEYLEKMWPGGTAKIEHFWPNEEGRRLRELFVDRFPGDIRHIRRYRVVNGGIRRKPTMVFEIPLPRVEVDTPLEVRVILYGLQPDDGIYSTKLSLAGGGVTGVHDVTLRDGEGTVTVTPTEPGTIRIKNADSRVYAERPVFVTVTTET